MFVDFYVAIESHANQQVTHILSVGVHGNQFWEIAAHSVDHISLYVLFVF